MPEEPQKLEIGVEELKTEKLSEEHRNILEQFKSSNKELKDFLIEDSLTNQEINISTTYLFFHGHPNKLAAYVTICTDAIRIHGTRLGKDFQDQKVAEFVATLGCSEMHLKYEHF